MQWAGSCGWVVAYLKFIFFSKYQIFYFINCNFLVRTLQCFLKKILIFDHQKLKKPPSKVAQNSSNPLFSPYCPDCPNSPKRRIHVPKCDLLTNWSYKFSQKIWIFLFNFFHFQNFQFHFKHKYWFSLTIEAYYVSVVPKLIF